MCVSYFAWLHPQLPDLLLLLLFNRDEVLHRCAPRSLLAAWPLGWCHRLGRPTLAHGLQQLHPPAGSQAANWHPPCEDRPTPPSPMPVPPKQAH